jgi:curved DNA-binding protein CbpA
MGPDPFDELGLLPSFDLDPAVVERAYLQRAAALHPDLAADPAETARAAARLNHAKQVLDSPERRANALLARLGGTGLDMDRSLPDGFLTQIMQVRADIEADGVTRNPAARSRWEAWAQERRREHINAVSVLFLGLSTPPSREALHAIRMNLNAWRYIERLIEQLDPDYDPARADFR